MLQATVDDVSIVVAVGRSVRYCDKFGSSASPLVQPKILRDSAPQESQEWASVREGGSLGPSGMQEGGETLPARNARQLWEWTQNPPVRESRYRLDICISSVGIAKYPV